MPILYYLGADDTHVLTEPTPAVFTRADDEPHPYTHVDQEAASAIAQAHPDLFAIKDALPAIVATSDHVHALTTGVTPPPTPVEVVAPTRRTRASK